MFTFDRIDCFCFRGADEVEHRKFRTSSITHCESKNRENKELQPPDTSEKLQSEPYEETTKQNKSENGLNARSQKSSIEAKKRPNALPLDSKTASEQVSEQQKEVNTSKEDLLKLLGAMKVDISTKHRKTLRKGPAEQDPMLKPTRVELESTSTMFQQATSSQR